MQYELTRLTSENIELRGKVESLDKLNHKLKRQVKLYNKKFNTMEGKHQFSSYFISTTSSLCILNGFGWKHGKTGKKRDQQKEYLIERKVMI